MALASILSQYLSAALIILMLFRTPDGYGLRLARLRLDGSKAGALLKLGLPCGIQYSIFGLANLFIQIGVNSFDATVVAGNSAAANADSLFYDVMAAFYTACSSFIGQNYGAGNRARIRKAYRCSLLYSFGAGAVLARLLVLFGRQFLATFTPEADAIDVRTTRLMVMSCSYAFSAFMDATIAAALGSGPQHLPPRRWSSRAAACCGLSGCIRSLPGLE
ncbi:MAG: MATE family efflux transporter [Oscillospiraceae bacterium]